MGFGVFNSTRRAFAMIGMFGMDFAVGFVEEITFIT